MDQLEPSGMTRPFTENVLGLLETQADLLGRLEGLADRQRALVTGDDTRALLTLLSKRRRVTSELVDVGQRLAPARRDWASVRRRLSRPDAERADEILRTIGRRMKRVIDADERDVRVLEVRKSRTRADVGATISAQTALSAYGGGAADAARLNQVHAT